MSSTESLRAGGHNTTGPLRLKRLFVIVGAIIVLGGADDTFLKVIGFVAMVLATANVVGGWFVTDRMLEMFKKRPEPKREPTEK